MTYNYYLNRNQKNNKIGIFLYVREKENTIVLHTGEYLENKSISVNQIAAKYWDSKLQKVKSNYIGAIELNEYLMSFKNNIQKLVREYKSSKPDATFENVKEMIMEKYKPKALMTFHNAYNQFLELKKNSVSPAFITKLKTLQKLIIEFEETTKFKVAFSNIDLMFKDLFQKFLIENKNHSQNTIAKYFELLKTFLIWSAKRNLTTNFDFKEKEFNLKKVDTDITYLTENELMNLYEYDFSNNERFDKIRDIFCFCCFTGQRFSDVSKFKFSDIINNSWHLHTLKTKDFNKVPLSNNALAIVDKYKQQGLAKLPTISNQKTNFHLKEVCKEVGINDIVSLVNYKGNERIEKEFPKYQLIGTHTGRRTFVTLSLEKGMRAETLMQITGHKSISSFKKYIKITESVKSKEMAQIWNNDKIIKIA